MRKLIELGASIGAAICAADEYDGGYNFERDMKIRDALMALPTVDAVEVRHGRWKWDGEAFVCSACGSGYKGQPTMMGEPMFEFCPICGADMRKDGDNEQTD